MARRSTGEDGTGRFSKSGNTKHTPHQTQPMQSPRPSGGDFGAPTYHQSHQATQPTPQAGSSAFGTASGPVGPPPGATGASGQHNLARTIAAGTYRAARRLTRRIIDASNADGAKESGLSALIWNQVLSYGTDAMVTVALASTVFFGASSSAQRGNILLYLLITMAPFAVVAPVVGPMLDRFSHGRRWAIAATGFIRAVLALVMSAHSTSLLVLYPCALGSLVCSKAFSVLRAAASPRLVPSGLTQNQVNARLSIFGLGASIAFGAVVGVLIKITGSYGFGLFVTALTALGCAIVSLRLPQQVDSARRPEHEHGGDIFNAPAGGVGNSPERSKEPLAQRLLHWARRGFDESLITAFQGECALRLLSGMLTIFLAFYVQRTAHGFEAAWHLGLIAAGAGLGNFIGVAAGTRLRKLKPLRIISISVISAAAACALAALFFSIWFIALAMLVVSVTNAIARISLDSLIQGGVPEWLRSSAFARSETFLQLAWVLGAALGVGLSAPRQTAGAFGFWAATVIVGAVAVLTSFRSRAVARREAQ